MQLILVSTGDTVKLDKLADLADKIMETSTPTQSISGVVHQPAPTQPAHPEIQRLEAQLAQLTLQVQTLS